MCGCGLPVVWAGWPIDTPCGIQSVNVLLPFVIVILRQVTQNNTAVSRYQGLFYQYDKDLPVCRPFLLASFRKATRAREWTTVGFLIMRPWRSRRAILRRELAREISLISLGSSQILRSPHFSTDAARRFWSFKDTKGESMKKRQC